MNRNTLGIVAIITMVVLIAAVFTHRSQQADREVTARANLLLPQLAAHLDDVSSIKLSMAGQKEIATFTRGAKGWVVANRSDYPAAPAKLREFVLQLSDARTIEAKTKNPDLYSKLGVEDVTAANAAGVLVELEGMPKKAAVIIGNFNGGGGGGTFVRRPGEDQSWLIADTVTVDRNVTDWIAKEIADIPSSRIREVVIEKGGKALRVSKSVSSDGNFLIDNIPNGRKPTTEFAANGLAGMLSGLRVDDVATAVQVPAPAEVIKAHYLTENGVRVDATAWTDSDKHYAQFKASVDDSSANDWIGMEQAKQDAAYQAAVAEGGTPAASEPDRATAKSASTQAPDKPLALTDAAQDHTKKRSAIQAQADRLNATFDGWTFMLPAYKFDNINKGMDDLLLPVEAAKAESTSSAKSNKK